MGMLIDYSLRRLTRAGNIACLPGCGASVWVWECGGVGVKGGRRGVRAAAEKSNSPDRSDASDKSAPLQSEP